MKSIRASLIAYFWLLLALGLGTASLLAYRIAADSMRSAEAANRSLREAKFEERKRQEESRFDDQLLDKAQKVADKVQRKPQWDRLRLAQLVPLGLMAESQAHLLAPLWVSQASSRNQASPFSSFQTARRLITEIRLDESDLPHDRDDSVSEYYQVDTEVGVHWPLGPGETPMFQTGTFDPTKGIDWSFDNVTLATGTTLRRVQLKASAMPYWYNPPRRGPLSGIRTTPPPPGDRPPSGTDRPAPWLIVHCASETTRRDQAIEDRRKALGAELNEMAEIGQQSLAGLSRRLVAIALVTFLLTTIGGYLLVGVGLSPLRRLTDAVSRITSRDFRLPLEPGDPLPNELVPIHERLQHTLDELRKAFEREKQAAADISHELRTPVASMLTTVEVALRKPRSPEEYRHTLEECRGVARQMRHLVERLLALARLDAGSDKLRPRPVNVGDLVQECAALVKPLAGERGLELRVECPKPVVWTTDPDKLREVIVNLLHNAVQYNRPEGSIDVSAQAHNGWLDVQVHDTGVGITKDAFDRIFERFYRADPSRHATELHAGLGLSIVKGYVGLLGGTITVESQVGQGSTFRVRLPNAAAAA